MSPRRVTICQCIFWVQQLTEPTGPRYVCSLRSGLNCLAYASIAFVRQRWFYLCENHHLFQSGSRPLRCPVDSPDRAGKLFPERTSSSAHVRVFLAYRRGFQAATGLPALFVFLPPTWILVLVHWQLVKWLPVGGSNDWSLVLGFDHLVTSVNGWTESSDLVSVGWEMTQNPVFSHFVCVCVSVCLFGLRAN